MGRSSGIGGAGDTRRTGRRLGAVATFVALGLGAGTLQAQEL